MKEIKSSMGDALYRSKDNAIRSFSHLRKPHNYTLLEKNDSYLVTTNRRSSQFRKDGWKEIGHGMPKSKGINAIKIPFRSR